MGNTDSLTMVAVPEKPTPQKKGEFDPELLKRILGRYKFNPASRPRTRRRIHPTPLSSTIISVPDSPVSTRPMNSHEQKIEGVGVSRIASYNRKYHFSQVRKDTEIQERIWKSCNIVPKSHFHPIFQEKFEKHSLILHKNAFRRIRSFSKREVHQMAYLRAHRLAHKISFNQAWKELFVKISITPIRRHLIKLNFMKTFGNYFMQLYLDFYVGNFSPMYPLKLIRNLSVMSVNDSTSMSHYKMKFKELFSVCSERLLIEARLGNIELTFNIVVWAIFDFHKTACLCVGDEKKKPRYDSFFNTTHIKISKYILELTGDLDSLKTEFRVVAELLRIYLRHYMRLFPSNI